MSNESQKLLDAEVVVNDLSKQLEELYTATKRHIDAEESLDVTRRDLGKLIDETRGATTSSQSMIKALQEIGAPGFHVRLEKLGRDIDDVKLPLAALNEGFDEIQNQLNTVSGEIQEVHNSQSRIMVLMLVILIVAALALLI